MASESSITSRSVSGATEPPSHVKRHPRRRAVQEPYGDDAVAPDGHVAPVTGIAAAVHDPAVFENEVVGTCPVPRFSFPASTDDRCGHERQSHFVHVSLSESG